MSSNAKHRWAGLTLFVVLGLVPFLAAFVYALLYSLGVVGVVNDGFTLAFWKEVLASGEYLRSFLYSGSIAAVSLLVSVLLALWLVLGFRRGLEKKWMSFVLYLPLALPGVVSAFFAYQLLAKTGLFARLAFHAGWIAEARQFPDLVNDAYAFGIVLTFVTVVVPFLLLLFLNVYQNEGLGELSVLARSLGATAWQSVWRVEMPVLLRKTWVLIALYFIFLLGSYEVPLILGQESPQMLSVLIVREIRQYDLTKISEGYVVAVMYTVLVSVGVVMLFSRKQASQP